MSLCRRSLLDKHDCLITRLTGDLADAYVGWEGLAFSALGTMLGRAPRFPKRMAALKRSMDFKLADDDAQDAFCAAFAAWARQHQPDDDDDDEGPANAVRVWQLPPRFRMARMATAVAEAEFALPPRHSAPPRGRAGPSQPKASTCHLCRRGIRESGVLLGPSCRMRLHEAVGTYVKSEATKARLLQLLADDQLDEFDAILKVSLQTDARRNISLIFCFPVLASSHAETGTGLQTARSRAQHFINFEGGVWLRQDFPKFKISFSFTYPSPNSPSPNNPSNSVTVV